MAAAADTRIMQVPSFFFLGESSTSRAPPSTHPCRGAPWSLALISSNFGINFQNPAYL